MHAGVIGIWRVASVCCGFGGQRVPDLGVYQHLTLRAAGPAIPAGLRFDRFAECRPDCRRYAVRVQTISSAAALACAHSHLYYNRGNGERPGCLHFCFVLSASQLFVGRYDMFYL